MTGDRVQVILWESENHMYSGAVEDQAALTWCVAHGLVEKYTHDTELSGAIRSFFGLSKIRLTSR